MRRLKNGVWNYSFLEVFPVGHLTLTHLEGEITEVCVIGQVEFVFHILLVHFDEHSRELILVFLL